MIGTDGERERERGAGNHCSQLDLMIMIVAWKTQQNFKKKIN